MYLCFNTACHKFKLRIRIGFDEFRATKCYSVTIGETALISIENDLAKKGIFKYF